MHYSSEAQFGMSSVLSNQPNVYNNFDNEESSWENPTGETLFDLSAGQ